jgi:general secretion pathway protein D
MHTLPRRPGALVVSALLSLAVAGASWAQVTPTAPAPGAAGTTTATRPTGSPANRMLFNFTNAPVSAILNEMSERFGFIIIQTQPVPGTISMTSRGEYLTAEQAIPLLNDVLYPLNFATLQTKTSPPNERTILRIVTVAEAKKSQIPVFQGADATTIPLSDTLRTQVIPLQSVDAVRLRQDLTPLLSADADVAANAGSNTIVVTDTAAKIHRLVEIIQAMDHQQITKTEMKQRTLKYSNSQDASRLLNNLFNPQNTGPQQPGQGGGIGGGRGGRGGANFFAPGAAPGGGSTGVSDYARSARLYTDYDTRTNTVVMNGPPDLLDSAMKLLDELDSNHEGAFDTVFFVYPLKNAQALDLEPVLNRVFGATSTSGFGSTTTSTFGNRGGTTGFGSGGGGFGTGGGRGGGGLGGGGRGGGRAGGGGFGGGGGGGFGGGGGGGFGGNRGTTGGNRGATGGSFSGIAGSITGTLTGNVFVVANQPTNSLLVTTTKPLESQVKQILEKLDRPVPQVLIKVIIAEVTHSNSDDIGFEFSGSNFNAGGTGITAGSNVLTNTSAISNGATGGLKIGLVESQVNATLQALAKQSKLDVISRPYILIQDNVEAYMIIGQQVPYVTNSQITTDGNTINSVAYTQVGTILDVMPHINPDGLVTLDIAPQVSQLDSGSGVPISVGTNSSVSAPTFTIRQALSRVAIKNGETIVIGGLMSDQRTQIIDKIPVLGDIPYLGMLFKRTQNQKSKTELLIFLTPHVALQPDLLKDMSEEEQKNLKLVPNAVQPGVWEDHLKGMRAGATTTQPSESLRIEGGQLKPDPNP